MRRLVLMLGLALAGCNTVAGLGQDISTGAQTVGGWIGAGG